MALHVNFGLLEDDCCRTAFLRGAFLAGGSVTDPEKRYHMELATSHKQASREVSRLLEEMGFCLAPYSEAPALSFISSSRSILKIC